MSTINHSVCAQHLWDVGISLSKRRFCLGQGGGFLPPRKVKSFFEKWWIPPAPRLSGQSHFDHQLISLFNTWTSVGYWTGSQRAGSRGDNLQPNRKKYWRCFLYWEEIEKMKSYSYMLDLSAVFQDNPVPRWSGGKSIWVRQSLVQACLHFFLYREIILKFYYA